MPNVLITGANRGLGLEFVRQYAEDGWSVLATCRQPELAAELNAIDGVTVYKLDVNDFDAVEQLAADLSGTAIDVLISNAGVYGPKGYSLDALDYDAWEAVLRTNVLAPMRVVQCFAPHVAQSGLKRIATLSSKMGSMADNSSGGSYIYRSSKAGVNAVMKSAAHDFADQGITSVILHPGWVRTDMGGPNGLIDAPESVRGMRGVIDGATAGHNGRFFNYDGAEIPW
ncbi:SDR family oxidoreductase [Magnetovibrio sp. PR-2]|uniref:SDR family oxidoreductase n=1 Tax=Magnetovibrio sp. PR-2 TaxID=3120356 RepID=UPI002FCE0E65